MKKNIFKFNFITAILSLFLIVSCDSILDQDETDFGKGPIVVQFSAKTATGNFLQDENNVVYDYSIPIEYQGKDGLPLEEDVTITIAVAATSEATEGVEFSLSETNFTIPAGEKIATASIQVISENLDSADPKTLVLEIVSSSQTVSDKNETAIVLQAICPSELEGAYTYSDGNGRSVTVDVTGAGTYSVSADNAFTGEYPLYISDVCGDITITGGYLQDNFGIAVSGSGSVDEATGVITLVYTADGYFDNRTMTLVPN
ncbi:MULTISPECIES: hypothetical protein [unclassified Cellulophaga]|uniref:hypothetical protein n=1 Tax=unclassified Cellulophaga TaxID=2634405 RepID=UPI0026E2A1EC|nr:MULTISPECIES: hypothetical protein [unclassified Cellulophaga]MDO6491963.1 hypothetical protein [Cellulophaga sp. 2_MG-2023]MDO6495382.1 hypothetical protein [Cellulophaga sp. 3_MG-2023]